MTSRPRHMLFLREVSFIPALQTEGAGNAGRPMRPRSRVQDVIVSAHEHTGHIGITRPSPRNGLRIIACSPRCAGFLVTVACAPKRRLDTSVGVSGPHVFTVRKKAPSSEALPASTASCPALVTLANAPLGGTGRL